MTEKIDIWTDEDRPFGKAAVPRMATLTKHIASASSDALSQNLETFLQSFDKIVTEASSSINNFYVDEIELSLVVNGKGGIELLGRLEAGAEASIKVKLRKKITPEIDK
jgi:hypothetical protein